MGEEPLIVMYCLDCEWDAYTTEHTRTELDVLTVEHELITGHKVASVWICRDQIASDQLQVSNAFWQKTASSN